VLAGSLCVLVASLAVMQGLLLVDGSLGHPAGLRQACIPLGFALAAGPFLLWALRRPGEGREWLRLGAPRPGTVGRLVRIAVLGMMGAWAAALLCSLLPGYRQLVAAQATLGGWRTPAELARAVVLLAALPAFFEELFFRGYLLDRLERAWGPRAALVGQAALFAPLHGPAAPVAAVIGLVNGSLARTGRSLWPGILLHFLNNLAVVAALRAR
jgi:membrane protease YdiL (CAAX protease family)